MRKLFLILSALLLFVAASPQKVEQYKTPRQRKHIEPLNTKIDSANLKASEINSMLRGGI